MIPPVTHEPLVHADATPNADYPLRILRAHRANCDVRWASDLDGSAVETNPFLVWMNAQCAQRAVLLDRAIAMLSHDGGTG